MARKVKVMYKRTVLWNSVVGSHLWSMNMEGSDTDRFIAFAYHTEVLLKGYSPKMSFFIPTKTVDYAWHEIGVVIEQLIKCNINFIIGVVSNLTDSTSAYHKELQEYVRDHPCKGIYHSIHGLAVHNFAKYMDTWVDRSEKRCNKILRVLQFGTTLLNTGKYEFKPFYGGTPELVVQKIAEFDDVYKESELPEKMDEGKLRDLLLKIRIELLKEGDKGE